MIALERGLHPPPLLPPGVAIGGEQALAPVRLDPIEHPPLAVVLVVVLEDVLDVLGMAEQVGLARQREPHDVALARRLGEELDRIRAPLQDVPGDRQPAAARAAPCRLSARRRSSPGQSCGNPFSRDLPFLSGLSPRQRPIADGDMIRSSIGVSI